MLNVAEAVLRSVGQNSRLAISRTQAGWLMIGALMTMGEMPSTVIEQSLAYTNYLLSYVLTDQQLI